MKDLIQRQRMIRQLKKRRVKNYEFTQMGILSYTKRLSEIREVYGNQLHKERVYDREGKATSVFEYWITKPWKPASKAMRYEIEVNGHRKAV